MPRRSLLVTGFGPFRDVTFNPSGAIADALSHAPPAGWHVTSAVLPVTFEDAPRAIDQALSRLDTAPQLLLGLGVHPGRLFRLEVRARAQDSERVTSLDVNHSALALSSAGGGAVLVSNDAGQYVCECAYHHLLARGSERDVPALFLHVPRQDALDHVTQARIVRDWLAGFALLLPSRL